MKTLVPWTSSNPLVVFSALGCFRFQSRAFQLIVLVCLCVACAPFALAQDSKELNIRTFGARCDGSDDTRAVQAALSALPDGGTLMFPCLAGITQVSVAGRTRITIAGADGGGVLLLTQTADVWSRAFAVTRCTSCAIKDMIFEGNEKDIVPFNIEDSYDTTVSGLTIRNVRHAGAAFLAVHNDSNRYLYNTIHNVGMDRSPGQFDTARGMWIGNVSEATKETNVTIASNSFTDISGTALAVHGSGITITDNNGARLNWACIKVLPLGGAGGGTLVAGNKCSGAGAKWLIGGGIMTEYYNSSFETTMIRENFVEGYSAEDVARVPDSPNVGINIANTADKISRNISVIGNTIRNTLYDGIQISGPTDNFLIDSNLIERTISVGVQWNGISLQGDSGKTISGGIIRRNLISGKFDGIRLSANNGTITSLTLDSNSVVSMGRDGVHVEVQNNGRANEIGLTDACFASIGRAAVWDNRPKAVQLYAFQGPPGGRNRSVWQVKCADPRETRPGQ
jgi:hypothetical protein